MERLSVHPILTIFRKRPSVYPNYRSLEKDCLFILSVDSLEKVQPFVFKKKNELIDF